MKVKALYCVVLQKTNGNLTVDARQIALMMDIQTTRSQPPFIDFGFPYEHGMTYTILSFHMFPAFRLDISIVVAYHG